MADIATDKNSMIDRVNTAWWRFRRVIAELDQDEIDQEELDAGWTAKDLIAHVAFWERKLIGWLQEAYPEGAGDEKPEIPGPGLSWDDVVDPWNEENYEANKHRAVSEVLAEAADTHVGLIDVLNDLPADPEDRYWSRWEDDGLWRLIAGNTYAHYDEHCQAIEAYLEETGTPGPQHP